MILQINFSQDISYDLLLKQKKIPCLIRIADNFEIVFSEPTIKNNVGVITEFDNGAFSKRVIKSAGGIYTLYEPGLITLEKLTNNTYKVIDLSIFYNRYGWCNIIENTEYSKPYQFGDCDDEDPDYVPEY